MSDIEKGLDALAFNLPLLCSSESTFVSYSTQSQRKNEAGRTLYPIPSDKSIRIDTNVQYCVCTNAYKITNH
jgi:hypothetical protein